MMKKHWIGLLLYCCWLFGLVSCSWSSTDQQLTIVLAVDQLGFDQTPCPEEELDHSGIALLCKESVRFTHAFTPSTSSLSAITSLLTGQWPVEHQVRSHGTDFLNPEKETLAEIALKKNWRTVLYSGGTPVLRRSGLHQGFELFEDNIVFKNGFHLRPFEENIQLFMNWLKETGKSKSLVVFYIPDLLFVDRVTTNHLGEQRNRSYQSQIEEFDESLFAFISLLKRENLWDKSYFFLVGLNGRIEDANPYTELRSRATQVSLFVKGPNRPRDAGLSWSIDDNITLTDVGFSIEQIITQEKKSSVSETRASPVISLLSTIEKPTSLPLVDRLFMVESSWEQSQNPTNFIHASARQEHLIYLFDQQSNLYNSLIDRFESYSMPTSDPVYASFAEQSQRFLETLGYQRFKDYKPSIAQESLAKCLETYQVKPDLKDTLSSCENKLITDFYRLLELMNQNLNPENIDFERKKFIIGLRHHMNDRKTRQLNDKIFQPWFLNSTDPLKELEGLINLRNDREAKKLLLQLMASI